MRNVILIMYLFILTACSTLSSTRSDRDYAGLLIGTWRYNYPEESGVITSGEKTYNADGTSNGFIVYKERTSAGDVEEVERVFYTSKWKIQNSIVVITDVVYSDLTPVGTLRDKIIFIGAKNAVFQDLSDGSTFERIRIK